MPRFLAIESFLSQLSLTPYHGSRQTYGALGFAHIPRYGALPKVNFIVLSPLTRRRLSELSPSRISASLSKICSVSLIVCPFSSSTGKVSSMRMELESILIVRRFSSFSNSIASPMRQLKPGCAPIEKYISPSVLFMTVLVQRSVCPLTEYFISSSNSNG